MSEQHDGGNLAGEFLLIQRDRIASGAFGDPSAPAMVERLAEFDAKIALSRQIGELPPANPWTIQRAAAERLAAEYPGGDPVADAIPEALAEHYGNQFDRLSALDAAARASLADQVAQDIADHTSAVTVRHAMYRADVGTPGGHAQVDALVQDALPAVEAFAEPANRAEMLQLLRCDRRLLETFAVRGRNMAGYAARKKALGL